MVEVEVEVGGVDAEGGFVTAEESPSWVEANEDVVRDEPERDRREVVRSNRH